MRWLAAVTLLAAAVAAACGRSTPSSADMPDPEAGIPLALATERARNIRDLRYELTFNLPSTATEPVTGSATISFHLVDATHPVVLDFMAGAPGVAAAAGDASLGGISIDGRKADVKVVNNHIVIPAGAINAGDNRIALTFTAGNAALNRNPDFLYTLFVPARAHLTFPCFDQPDLKARWDLTLTMPEDWVAIANGDELGRSQSAGRVTVHYRETQPISTYLFAFTAGRFQVETAERRGRTFRMLHRETDTAKVARNRDAIFDLHDKALAWLEDYTQIPYAFGKFDFAMIPSFQFGGMEHAGAILYNASSMLLDESATENQLLNRTSTISHETSHMWFGDLVTMRWFDDVWMKEVFANFMAAKIVNPSFPTINHDLRFLTAHYPQAYDVDRSEGTHPIRQPLDNLRDAGSQYGAIIYEKAPIVMRQLERLIGEDAMRDGLRQYLSRFKFTNATWLDLVKILDEQSDLDLAAWSRAWVEEAGLPTITTVIERDGRGTLRELAFTQQDVNGQPERQLRWTEKMNVLVGLADGSVRDFPIELSGARTVVAGAAGLADVRWVLPTGGGLAYGTFVLDEASRSALLDQLSGQLAGQPARQPAGRSGGRALQDPLSRGAAWLTLWGEVLDRRTPAATFIDAVLAGLPREDVQQNQQLMVGALREAYWRFSSPAERLARAPAVEKALRDGLARSTTTSAKGTFWSGFRSMALTTDGVSRLERVWSRAETVPGLPMAEPDEATMALELAVRDVPTASSVLTTQLARMTNPDRKARFAFVMPALSGSPEERGRFFATLSDVANRRREPWVTEGLAYLHHPLRAADSARFVKPSLDLLQDIQRTGDIFFPRNWMDATLSGYQSPEVAETVRQFLRERPDYPIRLRRIILQSADDLFRASRGAQF